LQPGIEAFRLPLADEAGYPDGDHRGSDAGDEAGDGVAEKACGRADTANIIRAEIS
jgi:hypothetical protein